MDFASKYCFLRAGTALTWILPIIKVTWLTQIGWITANAHQHIPKDLQREPYPISYYSNTANAPASLFYEVIFNVNDFKDKWYGENDTQPFVLSNGDPTGYGLHGDFVNGWDVNVLQAAITQCKDGGGSIEKCPVFQFFDDETRRGCQVPVKVDEQVQGQLDKLPGCNSIQRGPSNAQSESGCGATTEISQPQWGYKDVTSTLNYKYLGCARDPSGQGRTLPSAKTSGDSMTVDTCIKHCDGKGFAYAGLEYAKECWCGNSVADDRKPKKGLWGGCNMPCSGSQSEMCGGWAALSLYQKCNGTCQNAELI
ncbi:WSC domain protein [Colletotrichum tofieldiae]|nr:WSC domain protein [Colletotrichum tofieldiae]